MRDFLASKRLTEIAYFGLEKKTVYWKLTEFRWKAPSVQTVAGF